MASQQCIFKPQSFLSIIVKSMRLYIHNFLSKFKLLIGFRSNLFLSRSVHVQGRVGINTCSIVLKSPINTKQ